MLSNPGFAFSLSPDAAIAGQVDPRRIVTTMQDSSKQDRSNSTDAGGVSGTCFALKLLKGAAFMAGLILVCIVGGFFFFINEIPKSERVSTPNADGIVVLTGEADRITLAVDLLSNGKGKRLLISGVNPTTTRNALVAHLPQFSALFDCCIDLDYRALNTVGNAEETGRWVIDQKFKSVIVVTSNYHMPRSLLEMARVLPDIELTPYPVITDRIDIYAWWSDTESFQLLVSEYLKYIGALTRNLFVAPALQASVSGY